MATRDYVPVAADDWYQRRRDDAEGKFFRSVADQGPRKGTGGATRQGIYLFTADGKLLAYKNAGQAPDVMRETLEQGLREWAKLPEERRKPGAVKVGDAGKPDARYAPAPPAGGLVVKAYTRILDREDGKLVRGTCDTPWGDRAARDHLWLKADEWKALIPADPAKGKKADVPAAVADRILRFHLLDNTRGEPPFWTAEQVRRREMTLTVEDVTDAEVVLRLDGSALLGTGADASRAERGFDARLTGRIRYSREKKAITGFDVVAVGDHWGEGVFTRGARPGRKPLGVAFELTPSDAPGLVPPQGIKDAGAYFGRTR